MIKRIDEVTKIEMGQSPNSDTYNYEKNGLPFFQGKADFSKLNPIPKIWCSEPRKIAEKNDILISVRAPIGDVNIANEKCCIGRGLASIRALDNITYYKYIYYLLISKYDELNRKGTGSIFKAIGKSALSSIMCEVPNISKQSKIAKNLDLVQELININERQIELLDELVRSKFDEMFENKGYEKKMLEELSHKITDGSHNPPNGVQEKTQYVMISAQNIYNHLINYNNVRHLRKEDFNNENSRTNLQKGDVLLTIVGTVGRTAIVHNEHNVVLQRSIAVIKPNNQLKSEYLESALNSYKVSNELNRQARGVAQKGIYLKDIKKISIIVPPIDLQNQFAEIVKQIEIQKSMYERSIKILKELMDKLIDKYFKK